VRRELETFHATPSAHVSGLLLLFCPRTLRPRFMHLTPQCFTLCPTSNHPGGQPQLASTTLSLSRRQQQVSSSLLSDILKRILNRFLREGYRCGKEALSLSGSAESCQLTHMDSTWWVAHGSRTTTGGGGRQLRSATVYCWLCS
jgi:hypothetical protein